MDAIDQKLLAQAEKGIPLIPEPFEEIATNLGITSQEAISRLQKLRESGIIRRFGVSVKPNGVGYLANALVAWKVPQTRMAEVSQYFCRQKEVSHCYEREPVEGEWEYNLYTVMHAHERVTVEERVKQHATEVAVCDFLILFSAKNLKLKDRNKC